MTGHAALGHAEHLDEFRHGALTLKEQFEDFQPRRIAEATEQFSLELQLLNLVGREAV